MIELINRYCHGFTSVAIILSCRRQGLFSLLQAEGALDLQAIAAQLQANTGHLAVALRLLVSLGILEVVEGSYALSPSVDVVDALDAVEAVPDTLRQCYQPAAQFVQDSRSLPLWQARKPQGDGTTRTLIESLEDGAVMLPTLVGLHQLGVIAVNRCDSEQPITFHWDKLPPVAQTAIMALFKRQHWLDSTLQVTVLGRYLFQRILNLGVAGSYAPLLREIDAVLFGDPRLILSPTADGQEQHLDRTLNVLGSGFQHERYFQDLEQAVLAFLDSRPLAKQPRYIVDVGCGDGSLLKKLYRSIQRKSERGQHLSTYPLVMVGVDYHAAALVATKEHLVDIPHQLFKGDIGDPAGIVDALKQAGIKPETVLHVRSFLDHDRPFIAPADEAALAKRPETAAISVDANGRLIDARQLMQSLVEHLTRWSSVMCAESPLLLLEAHSLAPTLVKDYLDYENVYFDALQGFSLQHLVSAEDFLMAAAEAGLFSATAHCNAA